MLIQHASSYRSVSAPAEPPITGLHGLMRAVLSCKPCDSSPHFSELQRMVRATAAELRDQGCRPEEMIVALKRATRRGVLRPTRSPEDDLHYRMILWSVLEYFRCDR
jgi:hypothetical protein